MKFLLRFSGVVLLYFLLAIPASSRIVAASDPRLNQNNRVGIGLLSPEAEIAEAASMVNNNGDWGWAVVIIKKTERNPDRWQAVFNLFNKHHLIPIVRLATAVDSRGFWQKPQDDDAFEWADFLTKLHFPTKNRYVQIYNEVNHANEWGGDVDPEGYAKELEKTIKNLKDKSDDFFVLNAPLDLALASGASSLDAEVFFKEMEKTTPGIFNRLDGWASHSYPNPDFSASPYKSGRTGINGYLWELSRVEPFLEKDLPIFITETGWRRGPLSENVIAGYYKLAFEKVWDDKNIVAVAPFVFDYPDDLYGAFSFKTNGQKLGKKYYDYYGVIRDLGKVEGRPERENLMGDFAVEIPDVVISGFKENGVVSIGNGGNFIWNTKDGFKLFLGPFPTIEISDLEWDKEEVYPGETVRATFKIKGVKAGDGNIKLELFDGEEKLTERTVPVKSETIFEWLGRLFCLAVCR